MTDIHGSDNVLEDARIFVEEKWKNIRCERCESNDWTMDSDLFGYVNVNSDWGQEMESFDRQLRFLAIACNNCGNLALIWKGIFDKWRAGRTTTEE
jgi:ribosomal protein S27E